MVSSSDDSDCSCDAQLHAPPLAGSTPSDHDNKNNNNVDDKKVELDWIRVDGVDDKAEPSISHSSSPSANIGPPDVNIFLNSKHVYLTRGGNYGHSFFTIKFSKRNNIDDIQTCIINCNNQKILKRGNISFEIKKFFECRNKKGIECEQYFFEYGLIFIKKNCYNLNKFESYFESANKDTGLITLYNNVLEHLLGIKREHFFMYFVVCWYDPKSCQYGFHLCNESDKIKNAHKNKNDKNDKTDNNNNSKNGNKNSEKLLYSGEIYSNDYSFKKNDRISLNFIRRKKKHHHNSKLHSRTTQDKNHKNKEKEREKDKEKEKRKENKNRRDNKESKEDSGIEFDEKYDDNNHKKKAKEKTKNEVNEQGDAGHSRSIEHDKHKNKKNKHKHKHKRKHHILSFTKNNRSIISGSVLFDMKEYDCFYALSSMGLSTFEWCA